MLVKPCGCFTRHSASFENVVPLNGFSRIGGSCGRPALIFMLFLCVSRLGAFIAAEGYHFAQAVKEEGKHADPRIGLEAAKNTLKYGAPWIIG